jgi:hypothetical protein
MAGTSDRRPPRGDSQALPDFARCRNSAVPPRRAPTDDHQRRRSRIASRTEPPRRAGGGESRTAHEHQPISGRACADDGVNQRVTAVRLR